MVKIRLSRGGRKNLVDYTIVVTDHRRPRDSQYIAKLGKFDPQAKEQLKNLKVDAIKSWLAKGAHLSDTVRTVLKNNGVTL